MTKRKDLFQQLATLVPVPVKVEHRLEDQPSPKALKAIESELDSKKQSGKKVEFGSD